MKQIILIFAIVFYIALCPHSLFTQTILMEKKGGVYYVPCKVNDLSLKFIFDTGASNVSISLSEAVFMLKNGYLKEEDLLGTNYYRIANGDIAEGTKIVLRKIEIGSKVITNVNASIVHSLDAPLLLGQSAMERLGKFTIDYSNSTLTIGETTNLSVSNRVVSITSNFTALKCKDINGRSYKIVEIGKQLWMAENLNVDKFRNGDPIPHAKTQEEWDISGKNKQPAWCYYDNDTANSSKYGKLYNWYAVNDPRGFAPAGWHVPSDAEWKQLTNFLGGEDVAGKKMKSPICWIGTNESGFSGSPSGIRHINDNFRFNGSLGYWWSSTQNSTDDAISCLLTYGPSHLFNDKRNKGDGLSVRCIED